ncbi:MAG: hypothetical protein ABR924_21595 [Terracidiphilus sp.]
MTDNSVSRRLFMSAAAAASAAPALLAADTSDRIVIFDPPPARIRMLTATAASVVGPAGYTPAEVKQITSSAKNVQMILPANKAELDKMLPEVDVILGSLNADMLARAKNLRWLQAVDAGMEGVLFPELNKSNVVLTNMARMFAPAISESAFGMLLSLTRGYVKYYFPQFQKRTRNSERNLVEVDGMTMGFVGMAWGRPPRRAPSTVSTCGFWRSMPSPWPSPCSSTFYASRAGSWKWFPNATSS